MNAKHTPGPWKWFRDHCPEPLKGAYIDGADGGPRIADVLSLGVESQEVCEANARLIAAAPALLEALENATTELANGHRDMLARDAHAPTGCPCTEPEQVEACPTYEAIDSARRAIAQARGEQNERDGIHDLK